MDQDHSVEAKDSTPGTSIIEFAGPSTSQQDGFLPPPNPAIPQDLSLIMEMVATHQVVGSLPPLHVSAAEKRRLVEESLAKAKDKGKAKEEVEAVALEDGASDSSSENESSSEEESEDEEGGVDQPMTQEDHTAISRQLDQFVGGSLAGTTPNTLANGLDSLQDPEGEDDDDSSADSGSSEEDEVEDGQAEVEFSSSPLPTPRRRTVPLDMIDDDEGPVRTDPILSTHEVALPPVPLPPMAKLPEGEALSLAGDVVNWMKDRKVELWVAKEQAKIPAQSVTEKTMDNSKDATGETSSRGVDQEQQPSVPPPNEQALLEADDAAEVQQALLEADEDLSSSISHAQTTSANPASADLEDGELEPISTEPVNLDTEELRPEDPVSVWAPETAAESFHPSGSSEQVVPNGHTSTSSAPTVTPKFNSAGTLIIRAMQSAPQSGSDGWLEEGSVVCWEDGRVIGVVSWALEMRILFKQLTL